MVQLTKMQQRIYDYIAQTIRTQGYPPSVREIGDAVGLKSPSTVHFHLKHMEELGVIGKGAGKGRALTLTEPLPEGEYRVYDPEGDFLCLSRLEGGVLTSIKNFFGA